MSYRLYDPAPVYADLAGLQPAAGGSLTTYAQGTTTPKGTWSDEALTIANTNPITLDSAGRAPVNVWMDGAYTIVMRAADGTTIWTRDVDSGGGAGAVIPALVSGDFLTNDGSVLSWAALRQVPDPTGSGGKILGTDGSNLIWQAPPTIPSMPIKPVNNGIEISGTLIQGGSSTAPASGGFATQQAITFGTAFSAPPMFVGATVTEALATASSLVAVAATNITQTGATINFNTADSKEDDSNKITSPIPFQWFAIGPVAS